MSEYPEIFRIRQKFDRPVIEDVAGEVESQLARLNLGGSIQPGQSVAISAGSRGIANIHIIIKSIVDHLKGLGAEPFIVPAMGSHGGATAQGQQGIVEGYGITEAFCGCPIRSSMETVIVCDAQEGFPVHFDKNAYGADHVLVCGRVKPHTSYVGDIESGLMKMMLIGLGKYEGAKTYHRAIKDFSFAQIIRSVAREVLAKCRIVAGLAVVENGYDETAKIQAVAPDEFEEREKELLVLAKQWMPRLPFKQADLLMVDKIGKNISGSGMDSNVVGRKYLDHRAGEEEWPKIRTIFLRGLTEETHGNATGIGMAEFALTRAVDAMDVAVTRRNCITGGSPTAAMVPLHYASDREVL
ncbi:MAG TPA: [Fe-S]-binding protein, partial [Gammaproteobacteria bacterium]|nr:[Fe-S]-binding protein [Gammaproteobacteria bacterium]